MMRKTLVVLLPLLLLSFSSLFADSIDAGRWRVSVMASEISSGNQPWSEDAHAGMSVGVAYAPTAAWDMELTAGSQTHRSPVTRFFYEPSPSGGPGFVYPVTEFHQYRVRPLDLALTRHFRAAEVIAPYVRAGVRYVQAPGDVPSYGFVAIDPSNPLYEPVATGFGFRDRLSAQAGAGVRVRLTPRTALRVEAERLLRSDEVDFDPLTHYALGLSWRF
ncbi:MAG: hypothetical protein JO197_00155 [Acidobacteria bacterium]|nr:hypothetical protein [Acidobacteriota bacterium]